MPTEKWELITLTDGSAFLFDTRDVGFINIKYAYKMSSFIKNMKENEQNYLQFTIIIVNCR